MKFQNRRSIPHAEALASQMLNIIVTKEMMLKIGYIHDNADETG